MTENIGQISLGDDFSERLTVHKNVDQEVVVVTVDKLKLCLIEHQAKLADREKWIAPAGILITCIATLIAADFKDFGLSKGAWQAIFVIATLATSIWLIWAICKTFQAIKYGGVDKLVKNISNNSA